MKDRIRAQAFELGFDLVGFTAAASPEHTGEFHQWLADGCHGEMAYLSRRAAERADPRQLLPGAKSIVVVGKNYGTTGPAPLARYAAGHADYHEQMGAKLAQLAKLIGNAIWYVDTGPILERDVAQRAGIGWVGKHTNLISRQFGNWIFLAEILTTLELAPDAPEKNHCGTCTRCHTTSSWASHFTHPIALGGVHAGFPCERCHTNGLNSAGSSCTTCHGTHHGNLTDCAQCHSTSGWSPSTFQHPATSMPGWDKLACAQCHPTNSFGTVYCTCHGGNVPGD